MEIICDCIACKLARDEIEDPYKPFEVDGIVYDLRQQMRNNASFMSIRQIFEIRDQTCTCDPEGNIAFCGGGVSRMRWSPELEALRFNSD